MERSNNTIKELSHNMFDVISFYKELTDASKILNDYGVHSEQTSHIFSIINKA